jgi:ABC-type antimicrobial peptide transport system permease subunit
VLLAAAIVVPLLPKLSASLFRSQTYLPGWQWLMVLSTIITLLLMAMMIVVGVAIPAYRAMHIQPALALKEE